MVNSWNANTIHEHCKQHAATLGLAGELAQIPLPRRIFHPQLTGSGLL